MKRYDRGRWHAEDSYLQNILNTSNSVIQFSTILIVRATFMEDMMHQVLQNSQLKCKFFL